MLGKKSSTAVHALVLMASQPPQATTTAAELADHMGLSVSYLESLLKVLRENGLVRSTRGPGGGYSLAVPAAQLSLWSVAQVFEEPRTPMPTSGTHQIDLDRLLEGALWSHCQSILGASVIADHVDASCAVLPPREYRSPAGWGFKPLVPPWVPEAPNSVFQLSDFMGMHAVA